MWLTALKMCYALKVIKLNTLTTLHLDPVAQRGRSGGFYFMQMSSGTWKHWPTSVSNPDPKLRWDQDWPEGRCGTFILLNFISFRFLLMFTCCNMNLKFHKLQGTCCQDSNLSHRLITGTVKDNVTYLNFIISEQIVRSDPTICSFRYNPLAKLLNSPEHLPS